MINALGRALAGLANGIAGLWRGEQLFSRTLIESMPGVAYCYDGSGRFLRWNQNFETVSGYSADEIAHMHPLEFFAEQDRALVAKRIAEVFEKGESSVEAPFVSKDGRRTPYFFTGRRVPLEGKVCLVGAGIDIAERTRAAERLAESERRYRELVEHANSIILRWNAEGRVSFLNEFGQRFFGFSADQILGRNVVGTIVPPVDSSGRDLQQLMTSICAAPETFGENINENMRSNGERVWVSWTNRIVRDADGNITGLLSVGTDITERRRAEEKLRKLEDQVRQAQKMDAIGQLAGGVAHDFNNILWAILGNIQLAMADTDADHPARQSLEEIEKASLRARSLVRQILTFARHRPQERQVIDLRPTLEEAARFLRSTLPSTVDLHFLMDSNTPPACADATQVYQAVANLCTNAWHSLEGGAGRIEVRAEAVTLDETAASHIAALGPGSFACLSVTDTGTGMTAATLERIFEPFYTTKEPGKGTGLGLSVVHGIMQGHEGAITVTSEVGRGTTFRLYFPAAAGEAQSVVVQAPERGGGERILYLDDEESLVFLATRMLKRLGYQVSGYTSAQDALQAFRHDPSQFDLVITDLNMPGMAGLQVAAELLKIRPELPVVLCSGYVTDDLRERARAAGIREVFHKPSTIEEFSRAVHRLASAHRTPGGSAANSEE